jgi:transcription initiation factor TFIIIB Brf1 subunit/transcription initiation factor TFIIB
MSSSTCIEHSEVLDQHSGTIVCVDCCRVIDGGLTHFEVNQHKYSTFQENLKDEEDKISGENVIELLEKISDNLHLNRSSIDLAYYEYKKNKKKIQKILNYPNKKQRYKSFLSPEITLIFSIYTALNKGFCPRSIKDVCNASGLSECTNVLKLSAFFEKNKGDDTPSVRLQPLSAKDVLLTKYLYLGDITYEDVKQIVHKIDALKKNNFSPTATAAGAVYLYAKNVKSKKHTLKEISDLFNVASMTIQRFIDHYKPCF